MYDNEEYEDIEFDSAADALIAYFNWLPKNKMKMIDFDRFKTVMQTAAALKDLLAETNESGELEIDICDMFNAGSIKTKTDELTVLNTSRFAEIVSAADNLEIYPRTDGKLQINLTFLSVLKPVMEGKTL